MNFKRLASFASLAAAMLLSACSHLHHHGGMHQPPAQDSARPTVLLDASTPVPSIAVSPYELQFAPHQRDVEIVWTLTVSKEPGARKFRFLPERGITIVGEVKYQVIKLNGAQDRIAAGPGGQDLVTLDPKQDEIVQCRVSDDGLQARCLNRHTRPGRYKYAVVVTDGKEVFAIDPPLANW